MMFRKVAGPMKITSSAGSPTTYRLPPKAGGRAVKTLQYFVKITAPSSATTQVGMAVEHGPELGWFTTLKTDIIAYATVSEGTSSRAPWVRRPATARWWAR